LRIVSSIPSDKRDGVDVLVFFVDFAGFDLLGSLHTSGDALTDGILGRALADLRDISAREAEIHRRT
jgi:hypothetical protein